MTASAETIAAFEAWKMAELAAYYAAPCPDEVMDHLVGLAGDAFETLMAAPAINADDMLLKLFPVILRELEPKAGEPPLRPSKSCFREYDHAFYERMIADLGAVSPQLRAAIDEPLSAAEAAA